jgi:hypothetical protein
MHELFVQGLVVFSSRSSLSILRTLSFNATHLFPVPTSNYPGRIAFPLASGAGSEEEQKAQERCRVGITSTELWSARFIACRASLDADHQLWILDNSSTHKEPPSLMNDRVRLRGLVSGLGFVFETLHVDRPPSG